MKKRAQEIKNIFNLRDCYKSFHFYNSTKKKLWEYYYEKCRKKNITMMMMIWCNKADCHESYSKKKVNNKREFSTVNNKTNEQKLLWRREGKKNIVESSRFGFRALNWTYYLIQKHSKSRKHSDAIIILSFFWVLFINPPAFSYVCCYFFHLSSLSFTSNLSLKIVYYYCFKNLFIFYLNFNWIFLFVIIISLITWIFPSMNYNFILRFFPPMNLLLTQLKMPLLIKYQKVFHIHNVFGWSKNRIFLWKIKFLINYQWISSYLWML